MYAPKILSYLLFALLKSFKCFLVIFLLLSTKQVFAISDFYQKKAEGWFWYNDPVIEKQKKEYGKREEQKIRKKKKEVKGSEMKVPEHLTPESARAFKEEFQKKLDDAKNMWLFSGEVEYAAEYLRMQKRVLDFAGQGASIAARAKRIYPDLNDEILNPTSQTARSLFEEQKKQLEDKMINEYAKEFHLVYFTDPNSKACQIFANTLAEFANQYGFKVFAQEVHEDASINNQRAPKLFEVINDKLLLRSVAPKHLPALVAIDPETREWQPISYHMPTFYELRMLVLETIKDIISKMSAKVK